MNVNEFVMGTASDMSNQSAFALLFTSSVPRNEPSIYLTFPRYNNKQRIHLGLAVMARHTVVK